jgi:hypothetical protein
VLSIPDVNEILALLEAVCVDNNINVPPLALANEVTALTESFVIPAGSITPPVVMLFDKPLVILPMSNLLASFFV